MNQEPFATKHYLHYYPKGNFPPYLAYEFRAIFLLLFDPRQKHASIGYTLLILFFILLSIQVSFLAI